jgi:hypothetical protein
MCALFPGDLDPHLTYRGQQLEAMKTPYQFLMMTGSPEKESAFRAAKRKAGSHFAFHGSRICTCILLSLRNGALIVRAGNWHSIMRIGLKNFSMSDPVVTR